MPALFLSGCAPPPTPITTDVASPQRGARTGLLLGQRPLPDTALRRDVLLALGVTTLPTRSAPAVEVTLRLDDGRLISFVHPGAALLPRDRPVTLPSAATLPPTSIATP